ncbi:MAG: bifunctional oligoribonuclease/PAP phosphatase NrnA [Clostridiales bacterium]|jgi:phosphoesterase RecJ-like protein|nr:bifunctional oligoribonuclease/PAP phosphatase NrnA [Clostridiales bacterium]
MDRGTEGRAGAGSCGTAAEAGFDGAVSQAGLDEIAQILRQITGRIAVLVHNSTDGDTYGSGFALCCALQTLGKDVALVHEEPIPQYLASVLPERDFYLCLPDEAAMEGLFWDAVVVFDTADPKLLGKRVRLLGRTDCVINVDHHLTNQGFGHYNHVDVKAAATAELARLLIAALGLPLDRDTAIAIYMGICTDTGGFSYSNTTCRTHEIAAETLRFGLDVAHLRYRFFDAVTPEKLRCHGFVANAMRFYGGGKVAVAIVPGAALAAMGATEADCEGLVNLGRNVIGVEVSVLAREVRPGEFRVNLRGRGGADVAEIAKRFDGGGHRAAAGCTVKAAPDQIEGLLLAAIRG